MQILGQKYLVDSEFKEETHRDKKPLLASGCSHGIKRSNTC